MAAHLRPRGQTTTERDGGSEPTRLQPAAGKCSGLLGGRRLSRKAVTRVAEKAEVVEDIRARDHGAKICVIPIRIAHRCSGVDQVALAQLERVVTVSQ